MHLQFPVSVMEATVVNGKAHVFNGDAFPIQMVTLDKDPDFLEVGSLEDFPVADGTTGTLIFIAGRLAIFVGPPADHSIIRQEPIDPSKMFVMENPEEFMARAESSVSGTLEEKEYFAKKAQMLNATYTDSEMSQNPYTSDEAKEYFANKAQILNATNSADTGSSDATDEENHF